MVADARSRHPPANRAGGPEPHGRLLSSAPSGARRLRVALDLAVTRLARTGIARAASGLHAALSRRDDVEVVPLGLGTVLRAASLRRRAAVLALDGVWHPWRVRHAAAAARADVLHAPHIRAPLHRGRPPLVVTVADLNFLVRPDTMSAWNGWYSRVTIRRVLAAADRIIAMSAATADDLDHLLGVDGRRVRVVHPGIEVSEPAPPLAPMARAEEPYVLFVGTLEPRKNLPRLVAAVERLRSMGRSERLVVAGGVGWGDVEVVPGPWVSVLGRVSDAMLPSLYARAACLALPSLHEGFGFPALEAMAHDCPVVVSNVGALPEICGDAAVFVDPLSVDSIAEGIVAAVEDADRLRSAGRARVRAFDWDTSAERVVEVYRELY